MDNRVAWSIVWLFRTTIPILSIYSLYWILYDTIYWAHAPTSENVLCFSISIVATIFVWVAPRQLLATNVKTRRQSKKKAKKTKAKSTEKQIDEEIPAEWLKDNPGPRATSFTPPMETHKKFRVPGLKIFNQTVAGILAIINLFIAQASLTSAPATQPMFWFFIGNFYIIGYLLWKTRRRETV